MVKHQVHYSIVVIYPIKPPSTTNGCKGIVDGSFSSSLEASLNDYLVYLKVYIRFVEGEDPFWDLCGIGTAISNDGVAGGAERCARTGVMR